MASTSSSLFFKGSTSSSSSSSQPLLGDLDPLEPLLDRPEPELDPPRYNQPSYFISILGFILVVMYIPGSTDFMINHFDLNIFDLFHPKTIPLSDVCVNAYDPKSCIATVYEVAFNGGLRVDSVEPLKTFLEHSVGEIQDSIKLGHGNMDSRNRSMVGVCIHLLDMSMDRLKESIAALSATGKAAPYFDIHTWLSGVLSNHLTCLDEIEGEPHHRLQSRLNGLVNRARASLAILVALSTHNFKQQNHVSKKLLIQKFQPWVISEDVNLLEESSMEIERNVTVAQDGSGNYSTIVEAVASAPDNSNTRYVIFVKHGTYKENVLIKRSKKNIMLIGEGMNLTIITNSLNYDDGVSTFNTGTIIVEGDGFIGQNLWIKNTAGPEKHQAVALRVSADKVAIHRCHIDAYQNTLYPHSYRQFYRECLIKGTRDIIYGDAAVVLQNCTIIARKPLDGQSNMVIAQGKSDPNQNTGTSLHSCRILPSQDLKQEHGSIRSYLGRPMRNYSKMMIMQSYIEDHIEPSGWSKGNDDTNTSFCYQGEYDNIGPGACIDHRVNWPGFHVVTDRTVAMKFSVDELIQGGSWLNSTGIEYIEGLGL